MGTSAAGAVAVGSGAYNITTAERSVTVEVVPDEDAYLSIAPQGSGGRSSDGSSPGSEPARFRFPGPDSQDHPLDDTPDGLGSDSVYEFTRDKDPENPDGLAIVTNQGTEPVEVTDDQEETDGPKVGLFDVEAETQSNGLHPLLREDPISLDPGEGFKLGIQIDTHDVEIEGGDEDGRYLEYIRFVAEAVES